MQIKAFDNELIQIKKRISLLALSSEPNTPFLGTNTEVKAALPPIIGIMKRRSSNNMTATAPSPNNIKSANLQKMANELANPESEQNWIRLNELVATDIDTNQ